MHGGRPKHEEPHVKKIKKRTYEKTEYILRVDLESLGINEDDFEDLQSLFEVEILREIGQKLIFFWDRRLPIKAWLEQKHIFYDFSMTYSTTLLLYHKTI